MTDKRDPVQLWLSARNQYFIPILKGQKHILGQVVHNAIRTGWTALITWFYQCPTNKARGILSVQIDLLVSALRDISEQALKGSELHESKLADFLLTANSWCTIFPHQIQTEKKQIVQVTDAISEILSGFKNPIAPWISYESDVWSERALFTASALFLDTETTGRKPYIDEPIQIGVINDRGEDVLVTNIFTERQIPPDATAVHNLTNEHIKDAPQFSTLVPLIEQILRTRIPCYIYNAPYDKGILQTAAKVASLPPFKYHEGVICAMQLYKRKRGLSKVIKLTEAVEVEKCPVKDAHTAKGDCLMLAYVMGATFGIGLKPSVTN